MKWEEKPDRNGLAIKSWCAVLDAEARSQAEDLARHPALRHHVALMPDCHPGYGMPIGGVVAAKDALIPNAVGVDIGCGMGAVRTDIPADRLTPTDFRLLMEQVKREVPLGFSRHGACQKWDGFNAFEDALSKRPGWMGKEVWKRARESLGTLGGGNHFIEWQRDGDGFLWIMIHSGSRSLGKAICDHYHRMAVKECERMKTRLPSTDLAFLETATRKGAGYIRDMDFALSFAAENRRRMLEIATRILLEKQDGRLLETVNSHHNHAALERHFGHGLWIHRKGATSARKGQAGIIPGSMGTASFIVEGLGNPDAFSSCSHGAGRIMGRNRACREIPLDVAESAMGDVVHAPFEKIRKGSLKGHHDTSEAPGAYKDIDAVMEAQNDLVNILYRLSPLAVLKG